MTKQLIKHVLLISSLLINCCYYANPTKSFTLGITAFPPLTQQQPDSNKCIGEAIDISKQIFNTMGHDLKIICAPAARIYKMMEQGTVDLTINVKSTRQLQPHATFIEPRFTAINLQIYEHDKAMPNLVAGIRSFDYHGYRQKLVNDGYEFIDLATADDAITMFIKGRTKALITYERPFRNYLLRDTKKYSTDSMSVTDVLSIGAYFGISKHSIHHDKLIDLMSKYVAAKKVKEFISIVD